MSRSSSRQVGSKHVVGALLVAASIVAGVAGSLAVMPASVQARRETVFSYPYSRVWTAAVRLMRVDFECSITEKDKDDGYFLFEYPDHGKRFPGSVELVVGKDADDNESVRVVIQVPAMPTYVEGMMMERLGRKLEQEFGPAKEPKRPPAKDDPDQPPADGDKPKPELPAKPKPGSVDKS